MASDSHDLEMLRGALFLSGLSESDFKKFAAETPIVTLSAGEILFHQGDVATAFYFVLDGWAALFREGSDGERTAIHLIGPGESFAEAVLAREAHYPVSAEAATDLRLARIDTARFRALILQSPELSLSIIAAVFGKLRRLVARIEQDQEWSPQRRVAAFLHKICGDNDGICRFELPVEQRYIAARLSMTPATLSRALSELAAIGVEAKRRRIVVSDVSRLARFVNQDEF
ncbi:MULTISPECIES: Crp/Fnr family transcriptional regulator [Hyphomicrobium]|jgi:CRP-like cAMP-binding protein|uniref:Crp/Fnr family transcriptional regulator n=1 Tax=Hyphomicrobium TaxID=81 RepID=UPI00035CE320|nr:MULTISPECIES: Crp/Fnr family transcriptional regulator [Hyphomicrobium]WBT39322.1 Crp/Fnr family transcriptional regulator [Hyphomicrobium sp. DMF-1]